MNKFALSVTLSITMLFQIVCFLNSFYAVEMMRDGHSPNKSCSMAAARIAKYYPTTSGGLICVTKDGDHGQYKNQLST